MTHITLSWQRRFALAAGVIIGLWLLSGQAGWYHFMRLRLHIRQLRNDIATLRIEREELRVRTRRFIDDATMKERVAREQLQLGYPDEIIYTL